MTTDCQHDWTPPAIVTMGYDRYQVRTCRRCGVQWAIDERHSDADRVDPQDEDGDA